jgi:hypothetical protein
MAQAPCQLVVVGEIIANAPGRPRRLLGRSSATYLREVAACARAYARETSLLMLPIASIGLDHGVCAPLYEVEQEISAFRRLALGRVGSTVPLKKPERISMNSSTFMTCLGNAVIGQT